MVIVLWIIIQAHIRNTDSYSDTDSEALEAKGFLWFLLKYRKRVLNNQVIDEKKVSRNFSFCR